MMLIFLLHQPKIFKFVLRGVKMKRVISFSSLVFFTIFMINLSGCAFKVPLKVDSAADMHRTFGKKDKIPTKVGLYIDEETKRYIFQQKKMGMTFFMSAGEYINTIMKDMAEEMFTEVIYVDALPPYDDSYRPDVEAVVTPEVLYCYGDAIGTLSGHIVANIVTQVTAYDLSGNVIWQNRATGNQKSGQKDFVASFLGGMADIGEVGYQAAFNSAVKTINVFYDSPPRTLLDLLEEKKASRISKSSDSSTMFNWFYEKGKSNFVKKNYHQALYCFMQASKYESKETPSIAYFIGVCYAYIADKNRALEYLGRVAKDKSKSSETERSQQWIQKLSRELNVGVIFNHHKMLGSQVVDINNIVMNNLIKNNIYNFRELTAVSSKWRSEQDDSFKKYLDNQKKDNIRIVICVTANYSSSQVDLGEPGKGEAAEQTRLTLSSKVYSTKNGSLIGTIEKNFENNLISRRNGSRITINNLERFSRMLICDLIELGVI
jgi:TPR repeat protein